METEMKLRHTEKLLHDARAEIESISTHLMNQEELQQLLKHEQTKKISAQKSASYFKNQLKNVKTERQDELIEQVKDQKSLLRLKDNEIDNLESEINELQENLVSNFHTKHVDGTYTDSIRLCVLELSGLEVAVEKVSPVIQAVCKHLLKHELTKADLPNRNTVQTIVDQGHFLAKAYISEKVDACNNWGLNRDGTTRKKQKIVDTSVTLDSGDIISLGFNRVAHEKAVTINNVTKAHLDELAELHATSTFAPDPATHKQKFISNSLQKLAFTMSDRASNEKLANKLLNDWRDETLADFDGDKKIVHSFYCMAHVLLGFHNYISTDMIELERTLVESHGPIGRDTLPIFKCWSKKGSVIERAVRTTSDVFGPAGEHHGARDRWEAHCAANGIKSLIGNYRDNRFNALFQTSAEVYVHKQEFLKVLGTVKAPNLKLKSVKADLESSVITAMLQCLGLFYVQVTGPYWNLCTCGTVPYLQLYPYISKLKTFLENTTENPALLLNSTLHWSTSDSPEIHTVQHQQRYDPLFILLEDTRELLFVFIKLVSQAMIKVINKQLSEFLPGGQFCKEVSADDLVRTEFAQVTNLGCEHHFGDLDSSQKRRPSASMHHHSSVQLLKRNRIGMMKWFDDMAVDTRVELMKKARKGGRNLRQRHIQQEKKVAADINDEMLQEKANMNKRKRKHVGTHSDQESSRRRRNARDDEDEINENERCDLENELKRKLPKDERCNVNEYVAVSYQDSWYPGIVLSVNDDNRSVVRFMTPCRKPGHFQWPTRVDEQTVENQFILKKGFVPNCLNSGRQWFIPEHENILSLYEMFTAVYF